MKLKFLVAAFAAVTMFTFCAEKPIDPNGDGTNPELTGKTAATFVLNVPQTRAGDDYEPNPDAPLLDADAQIINVNDLRLLIFDVDGTLECNEAFNNGDTRKTVMVTAGQKKIFVLANMGSMVTDPVMSGLTVGTVCYSSFLAATFEAGVPQNSTQRLLTRSFKIEALHTRSSSTTGLPATSNDEYTYTLKSGVTQAQAESGTPAGPGTTSETYNRFKLDLFFMLSKARVYTNVTQHLEGAVVKAKISDLKYGIHNLARFTYVTGHIVGGAYQSYYWGKTFTSVPWSGAGITNYEYHFDVADKASITIPISTTATGPFHYVTENNNTGLTLGQAAYYAVNGDYRPTEVVSAVGYEPTSSPKLQLTVTDLTASPFDYVLLRKDFTGPGAGTNTGGTIQAGTYFASLALLQQAIWLCEYSTNVTGGSWIGDATQIGQANALLTTLGGAPPTTMPEPKLVTPTPPYAYYPFSAADGRNWWRLSIGETPTTGSTKFGVVRGKKYTAKITNITGAGVPYEWMLDIDPEDPVDAETYVSVEVEIHEWTPADQEGELK